MNKRFYITTAIDYVNGQPHLGHAYEKIVADVIARSRRSMGQEVFFMTGLDEHGQKVQQAAQAEGKSPQAYCDELAADWRAFAKKTGIDQRRFRPHHGSPAQGICSGDSCETPRGRTFLQGELHRFLFDEGRNVF